MRSNQVGRLDSLRLVMNRRNNANKTVYKITTPKENKNIYSQKTCDFSNSPYCVVTPKYYIPQTKKGIKRFFEKFVHRNRTMLQVASIAVIGLLSFFGAKWASVPAAEEIMMQNYKYNFHNKTNLNYDYYENIISNDFINKKENKEFFSNIDAQLESKDKKKSFNDGVYIVKPTDNYWKIAEKYLEENMSKKEYKNLAPEVKETLVGYIWSEICDANVPLEEETNTYFTDLSEDIVENDPYMLYPGDVVKYNDSVLKNIIAKHK